MSEVGGEGDNRIGERRREATQSAVARVAVAVNPALTEAGAQVDAFAELLGSVVREELLKIAQEVLGAIEGAPSGDELVRRLHALWDEELVARAESLLEAAEPPADLGERLLDAARSGGVPALDDRAGANRWIAVVTWFLLCALTGAWIGTWAAGHRDDALAILCGLLLGLYQMSKDL